MDDIKYMAIYLDNSCEVHFQNDSSRIILSPCGSEFIHRTYSEDNTIQTNLKYRTAYPLSSFSSKLNIILKERNRHCNDRPFISPILLESIENATWKSTENLSELNWGFNLNLKNPIEVDYHNYNYVWKSTCKNGEIRLSFNRKQVSVKYPVKIPKSLNDEYEQKCEINPFNKSINKELKSLLKYTNNEEEFSSNHLPILWEELYTKMLILVEKLLTQSNEFEKEEAAKISIKLHEAMPLSCGSTHLHKFDDIETLSEPKVIYINQTWYKLFYKNKSIEISCPLTSNQISLYSIHAEPSNSDLNQTYDYLISDSLTGRFYTCFSLNKRNGEVEEIKICVENIPSFKKNLQKVINYSTILLKRLSSIKFISNYSTCYINKKLEEIEPITKRYKRLSSVPSITIEDLTVNKDKTDTTIKARSSDEYVKKQYVIDNVGHFKYMQNNTIVIHFADKTKLYMDDYSVQMYEKNMINKCFCLIYLPDSSQHEVGLGASNEENLPFNNYLDFLIQWLKFLKENGCIKCSNIIQTLNHSNKDELTEIAPDNLNISTLQTYLNKLKLFNYTLNQDLNDLANKTNLALSSSHSASSDQSISVSKVISENSKFLRNLSK